MDWKPRFSLQNYLGLVTGPPMKRGRWAEQNDLARSHRRRDVHRRGIDGYEQARLSDQRSQREQIDLTREIDDYRTRPTDRPRESRFNFSEMIFLLRRG